jgi:hypothetical protein
MTPPWSHQKNDSTIKITPLFDPNSKINHITKEMKVVGTTITLKQIQGPSKRFCRLYAKANGCHESSSSF